MKGKANLIRESDDKYHVYVKKYFWQRWKPCTDDSTGKQIVFNDFNEFAEVTAIESFDEITLKFDKFSGLGRK